MLQDRHQPYVKGEVVPGAVVAFQFPPLTSISRFASLPPPPQKNTPLQPIIHINSARLPLISPLLPRFGATFIPPPTSPYPCFLLRCSVASRAPSAGGSARMTTVHETCRACRGWLAGRLESGVEVGKPTIGRERARKGGASSPPHLPTCLPTYQP
eukprot:553057-Pleurochrysis_carterae.AAC.1